MPWCEECSKFWNPTSMAADGSCPNCGHVLATEEERPSSRAPWHFKLLMAMVAAYLGWRLIELLAWAF